MKRAWQVKGWHEEKGETGLGKGRVDNDNGV